MAIRDLQIQQTMVGNIRLGRKVKTAKGSERPDRLDTFRFTSPAQHLIEEISRLYGGTVSPWQSPRGPQFEVITEATNVPVYVPRQHVEPWYEQWGNGVCTRRCDGVRDVIYDQNCDCNADSRKCKPCTRINLMLADIQGLGVWRLETHGIYAASELSMLAQLIENIQIPIPARLLLESRMRKHWDKDEQKVVTKDYNVPIILVDGITARQVQVGGDALTQATRAASGGQQAVAAGEQREAIGSTPAQPEPVDIEAGLRRIAETTTPQGMQLLADRIKQLGSPEPLVTAYKARYEQLRQQAAADKAAAEQAAAEQAEAERVRERDENIRQRQEARARREAEGFTAEDAAAAQSLQLPPTDVATTPPVQAQARPAPLGQDESEREAALLALLGAAGRRGMNTPDIEQAVRDRFEIALQAATAEQLRQLAAAL